MAALRPGFAPWSNLGAKQCFGFPLVGNDPGQAGTVATLRQVGTRSYINNSITATANPQAMCRTKHYVRDAVTSLQVVYYNGYVDAGSSGFMSGSGGNMSITVTIEDSGGNILGTFLWSGVSTGVIATQALGISDALSINIAAGTQIWFRAWIRMTGVVGVPYMTVGGGDQFMTGEAMNSAATVTDQTLSGTITNNNSNGNVYPCAIIAYSSRPCFLLQGDSRVAGSQDSANSSPFGDTGESARSIGPTHGYINAGVSSITTFGLSRYNVIYHLLSRYVSHFILSPGINDLSAGATSTQVGLRRANIRLQHPRLSIFETTIAPHSDATNTTTDSSNPERIAANAVIRAQSNFIENANVNETAQDSGLWTTGRSTDFLHENTTGYAAIVSAGIVNPTTLGALNTATRLWSPWELIDATTGRTGIQFDLWQRADDTDGDSTGATWRPYNNVSNFTASAGQRAVLTANSYGTKPAFLFDGSNDKFVASAGLLGMVNAVPGFSIGVVATPTFTGAVGYFFHVSIASASATTRFGLFFNADTSIAVGGRRVDTDAFASATSPANNVSGVALIITGTIDAATGAIRLYLNGTLAGSGTLASTGAAFPASNSNGITIGSTNASTFPYGGLIAEEVGMQWAFSTDERQRLEGWLAWNWGLAGKLPSDHPYKNSAPTV